MTTLKEVPSLQVCRLEESSPSAAFEAHGQYEVSEESTIDIRLDSMGQETENVSQTNESPYTEV